MNSELYTSLVMSARPIAMTGGRTAQMLFRNGLPPASSPSASAAVQTIMASRNTAAMISLFLVVPGFFLINDCLPKKECWDFYQPGQRCAHPANHFGFSRLSGAAHARSRKACI